MSKIKVGVGQIWQDWDVRFRGSGNERLIQITSISGDGQYALCKNLQTSKITKIRVDRLQPTSTGYKLVFP